MYKLKERLILPNSTDTAFAKRVGITKQFFCEIQKGRGCSKMTAYTITKIYDENKEITDLFEIEQ